MRTVACRTGGCGRVGIVRTVHDTAVAPGIVTRPTLVCVDCGCQLVDAETAIVAAPENAARARPSNATRQQPERRA